MVSLEIEAVRIWVRQEWVATACFGKQAIRHAEEIHRVVLAEVERELATHAITLAEEVQRPRLGVERPTRLTPVPRTLHGSASPRALMLGHLDHFGIEQIH